MTDNDKALVKQLRWPQPPGHTTLAQAADRIEAQAAEIERLKREVMLQMGWKTEAQNEVERLRKALRNILDLQLSCAKVIARTALGETE